jgi:uncharacterized protein
MGEPIVHFEINAKDGKRAQKFYSTLFKWKIDANNPMNYGMINTGSKKGIQGGIGQTDSNRMPYSTFYVAVNNPQKYLDKAVKLGGRIVMPVTEIPNMVTFAQFADPEGNIIGLVKDMKPAPKNRTKRATSIKNRKRK